MIHIEHLHKAYGDKTALVDVSLHIPRGRIFGLLGPNGAGKTTLISILCGILRKTSGSLRVNGIDPAREPAAIKRLLGLVPQHLAFYPSLTAAENLDFYAGVLGLTGALKRERIGAAVAVADLAGYLGRRAERFSGGLKRRLNLAIGLLGAPALLILDEPTVGIDPQSRHFILQSLLRLREAGVTIIYTSHYMDEMQQICDELAIIDHGRIIVSGSLDELLRSAGADTLKLELAQPLDEALRQQLEAALGTPVLQTIPASLSLTASAEGLEQVLGFTRAHGLQLRSLRYGVQDLEQVYLRLTRAGLRD